MTAHDLYGIYKMPSYFCAALRHVLRSESRGSPYHLPDRSAGRPGGPNPLERLSWQDLRDEIYGGR